MKRKLNGHSQTIEYGRFGIFFIIPFFLVFAFFQLYPLIETLFQSFVFTYKNGKNVIPADGLSFGNYTYYVFGDASAHEFWHALGVTLVIWLINFALQLIFSLMFAVWFTDKVIGLRGTKFYKVVMYMPNIITAATVSVLFYNLFYGHGAITELLAKIGITIDINKGFTSLFLIAFIQFWMWYGNTMIILIAGIVSIKPSIYEAARVDGATAWQRFYHITMPLLKPVLRYVFVTSLISGLQLYDVPYLFNGGGPIACVGDTPIQSTRTVMMLIKKYITPGEALNYGKAAAYSIVLFAVTFLISLIFCFITKPNTRRKWRY